jgi:hypothetical protein
MGIIFLAAIATAETGGGQESRLALTIPVCAAVMILDTLTNLRCF